MFIISTETAEAYVGRVTAIEVSPARITLKSGEPQTFEAVGRNQQDQAVPLENLEWQVAGGGTIDRAGLFQAGPVAGDFAVIASQGKLSGQAVVIVGEGIGPEPELKSLMITPREVHLAADQAQTFIATGFDQNGQPMPLAGVTWQATGGQIDSNGHFVTGPAEGYFEVTAASGYVSGSATIRIKGTPLPQKLSWSGQVPAQKWTNFYMKVLTKFASSQELKMRLNVEVTIEVMGDGQLTDQKIEETRIALRELGLDDNVEVE